MPIFSALFSIISCDITDAGDPFSATQTPVPTYNGTPTPVPSSEMVIVRWYGGSDCNLGSTSSPVSVLVRPKGRFRCESVPDGNSSTTGFIITCADEIAYAQRGTGSFAACTDASCVRCGPYVNFRNGLCLPNGSGGASSQSAIFTCNPTSDEVVRALQPTVG